MTTVIIFDFFWGVGVGGVCVCGGGGVRRYYVCVFEGVVLQ